MKTVSSPKNFDLNKLLEASLKKNYKVNHHSKGQAAHKLDKRNQMKGTTLYSQRDL